MHKKFDHKAIETKWQKTWDESGIYNVTKRDETKEKEYILVELPYPSGNLHIGHWFAFAVTDIYVRKRRMEGKQVFFPMGFDAFGLPAENAAIKHGKDPKEWTDANIEHMTEQLKQMGNAFTWNALHRTCDPEYYRWTQWMFTKFFENDIAYRGIGIVNWCPSCNTVLANEQVVAEKCERCGSEVEKKEMEEWKMRITKYADRLVDDLEKLDWPEFIKESQRQWIGRSEGAEIRFDLSTGDKVEVFTTRPDTLFGATYMVLAPEHTLVLKNKDAIANWDEVEAYRKAAAKKAEQDRLDATKEKTGVQLEGITATNPANGEEIPVYIADYVLASYGTGAIMAVPAHDERDHAFATKFNIPIKQVVRKVFGEVLPNPVDRIAVGAVVYDKKTDKYLIQKSHEFEKYAFIFGGLEEGESYAEAAVRETLEETGYKTRFVRYVTDEVESHFYHPGKKLNRRLVSRRALLELVDDRQQAISREELAKQEPVWLTKNELVKKLETPEEKYAVEQLFNTKPYTGAGTLSNSGEFDGMDSEEAKIAITKKVGGKMTNTYRLRDWSVGRQRYWGVPVPIVYDPEGKAHAVKAEHLPWLLPTDVDFRPTGEPPLAKSKELKERTEKLYGEGWTPAVETLDTFVDSSWYFLRYLEPHNDSEFTSKKAQEDWMPIDLYFGGAEHTTMHLLYSRFWQKALYDLGLVTVDEPYKKRINRGLVLGPDGNKMSKSKGNVIDPDEQVGRLGADTVKMYLGFMGPYSEPTNYPWDMGGIAGIRRFLERVYGLSEHICETEDGATTKLLHKTILKVTNDIEQYKFNTAISALMILVNHIEKNGCNEETYVTLLLLLAPFAPHLTEELFEAAGNTSSIHEETWPVADATLAKDDTVTLAVQFNGKMRGTVEVGANAPQDEVLAAVKGDESLASRLSEKEVTKVIYVPGKIINIIISE